MLKKNMWPTQPATSARARRSRNVLLGVVLSLLKKYPSTCNRPLGKSTNSPSAERRKAVPSENPASGSAPGSGAGAGAGAAGAGGGGGGSGGSGSGAGAGAA